MMGNIRTRPEKLEQAAGITAGPDITGKWLDGQVREAKEQNLRALAVYTADEIRAFYSEIFSGFMVTADLLDQQDQAFGHYEPGKNRRRMLELCVADGRRYLPTVLKRFPEMREELEALISGWGSSPRVRCHGGQAAQRIVIANYL